MRETRDLLRRRTCLVRERSALFTHCRSSMASTTCRPSPRNCPSRPTAPN
jgi:hypothetical protein